MVATCCVLPEFVTAKDGIFPVPEAASPILVLSLVQVLVVPVPEKVTAVVDAP